MALKRPADTEPGARVGRNRLHAATARARREGVVHRLFGCVEIAERRESASPVCSATTPATWAIVDRVGGAAEGSTGRLGSSWRILARVDSAAARLGHFETGTLDGSRTAAPFQGLLAALSCL